MPPDTRLTETGNRRIDGLKFKSLSNRPIAKTINRPVNVNYFYYCELLEKLRGFIT